MGKHPEVSVRIVALITGMVERHGQSGAALMREAGFQPALLDDPDARIPVEVEERLWTLAAQRCADPLLGLHAAQAIRPGLFDVLDYAVRTAPDVRTALERLARYNRLLHDAATFELVPEPGGLRVEHRLGGAGRAAHPQAAEFTLASLVVVGSQLVGAPLLPRRIEFVHAPHAPLAHYQEVLGVAPAFGCAVNAVAWPGEVLDHPVTSADATLSRIVTQHAQQLLDTWFPADSAVAGQVRRLLARHMADGEVSLARAARELHLSERSLQRRLTQEGVRFADLVEDIRRELALRYVADGSLALGEVAYLLGYAEPSPFHRAFKRWTGTTPAAARRAASTRRSQEAHARG